MASLQSRLSSLATRIGTEVKSKLPIANPTATGLLTVPLIKLTGGSPAASKLLKSDPDGDAVWAYETYEESFCIFGQDTTRAASSYGDFAIGHRFKVPTQIDGMYVRAVTADSTGNLVVEARKNGSQIASSPITLAFGSQISGGGSTFNGSFSIDDLLQFYVTGVGGTPGKGLFVTVWGSRRVT